MLGTWRCAAHWASLWAWRMPLAVTVPFEVAAPSLKARRTRLLQPARDPSVRGGGGCLTDLALLCATAFGPASRRRWCGRFLLTGKSSARARLHSEGGGSGSECVFVFVC